MHPVPWYRVKATKRPSRRPNRERQPTTNGRLRSLCSLRRSLNTVRANNTRIGRLNVNSATKREFQTVTKLRLNILFARLGSTADHGAGTASRPTVRVPWRKRVRRPLAGRVAAGGGACSPQRGEHLGAESHRWVVEGGSTRVGGAVSGDARRSLMPRR